MSYPRVAIATNNGDMGGGEVMLLRIAQALRELDVAVTVVAPTEPSGLADMAASEGHTVTRLRAAGRCDWMTALRRWDRRTRLSGAPTILWCNGLVPAIATAGHRHRIVHLHQAPQNAAQRALVPASRAGSLATVVPSSYMHSLFPGANVLPNWTAPIATATRKRASQDPFVIGYLGRLSTDKGVVILAEAMRTLREREPGRYRLLVAGEPRFVNADDYAVVDATLRGIADITDRPGWMDRDEFFARIDVLAMPSTAAESFGLGAAEAMAARVPLVVTNVGALPEVVGPDAITVPPGDARALADALAQVLAGPDPVRVERLYQRWAERFSPEAGRRAVAELLEGLRPADR